MELAPAKELIEQLLSAAQQSHAEELARLRRAVDKACKSLHRKIRKVEARLQHSESTCKAGAQESQARVVRRQARLKFLEHRVAERDLLIEDLKERVQSLMVELKQLGNARPSADQRRFVPHARKRVQRARAAAARRARMISKEKAAWALASRTPESRNRTVFRYCRNI